MAFHAIYFHFHKSFFICDSDFILVIYFREFISYDERTQMVNFFKQFQNYLANNLFLNIPMLLNDPMQVYRC